MRSSVHFLFITLLLCSCGTEPDPIEYGFDHCNYCEMTVVDKGHAAVLVSTKGKTYKFDAIECMIHYIHNSEDMKFSKFLVCDYTYPGNMIDAHGARFLISEEIPSPMGGFLSAVADPESCRELQAAKGGEIFQWNEVLTKFQ